MLPEVVSRFWGKVYKTKDCWLWQGYCSKLGYGYFSIKQSVFLAHRIAWEIASGNAPGNLCVCHHCDNPQCVRPDHLFLGTRSDNTQDGMSKNRIKPAKNLTHFHGELHHNAKIKEADAIAIKESLLPYNELSKIYSLSVSHIRKIKNGQKWSYLSTAI